MQIIKLTSTDQKAVYINTEFIGHMYISEILIKGQKTDITRLGVTTHNNGGFDVMETPEEIIKLINAK